MVNLNHDVNLDEFNISGTLSIDTKQERANLRRFSLALNQVRDRTSVNPRILDIINYPSSVDMNPVIPVDHFYQDVFTDPFSPNAIAVKQALSTKEVFLLQGPPGTGKTTVIAEIVCQILHADKAAKILLVSQSNVAVDHAVKKVSKLLPEACIIRIGRIDKISKSSEKLLYANKLDEWVAEIKTKSTNGLMNYLSTKSINVIDNELREYIDSYSLQSGFDSDSAKSIDNQIQNGDLRKTLTLVSRWQKHLGKFEEFDEIFADNASIVAATCVGIASRNKVSDIVYDWVIVDEAARATPLETLIPIVKGKKAIMVGDHKQLPPVFESKVHLTDKNLTKADLEKSLFEDLFQNISYSAKFTLTEQFRMHPAISKMISEAFYPNEKLGTKLIPENRKHHLKWEDKAIIWLDTSVPSVNKSN